MSKDKPKAKRGFAAMSPEKQREIARRGGVASHVNGKAHQWTKEEAQAYASKGGKRAHELGTAHQWDTEEATKAGRLGGFARWGQTPPNQPE